MTITSFQISSRSPVNKKKRNELTILNDPAAEFSMCREIFRLKYSDNLLAKCIITITVNSSTYPHLWHVGFLRYYANAGGWTTVHYINYNLFNISCLLYRTLNHSYQKFTTFSYTPVDL